MVKKKKKPFISGVTPGAVILGVATVFIANPAVSVSTAIPIGIGALSVGLAVNELQSRFLKRKKLTKSKKTITKKQFR